MNRFKTFLIVLLAMSPLCQNQAQDVNAFWTQYYTLLNENRHNDIIQLLDENKEVYQGDVDLFLFNFLKANSYISLGNMQLASQFLFNASELYAQIPEQTKKELENYDESTDALNMIVGRFYYYRGTLALIQQDFRIAESSLLNCYRILFARPDHEQLGLFRDLHYRLGQVYLRMFDMGRAAFYLEDAKLGSEANLLFDNTYCLVLAQLGLIYLNKDNYLKAKIYLDEANYTLSEIPGHADTNEMYIRAILSSCYCEMGYLDEAKRIALDGIASCRENKIEGFFLCMMYTALGSAHFKSGDYTSAKAIFKKADEVGKKDRTASDFDRLNIRASLAISQYLTQDSKCVPTLLSLSNVIIDDVITQFSFMSSDERARYWDRTGDYLTKFNAILFVLGDEKNFSQIYNNVLFSKGLLLRASNKLSDGLAKTSNQDLQAKVFLLRNLGERLAKEELTAETAFKVKDSIRIIEKELSVNIVGYQSSDSIRAQYSWQNIRRSLNDGEAAIEFIQLPELELYAEERKEYYAAIIMKKGIKAPKIIRLCSEDSLYLLRDVPPEILSAGNNGDIQNQLFRQYLYGNGEFTHKRIGKKAIKFECIGERLYSLLWSPLEQDLEGVTTIYYSPIGSLNAVSFNAITHNDETLSMRFSLNLLSSTAEIPTIKQQASSSISSAVVYGGIDYDTDKEKMMAMARGYTVSADGSHFVCENRGSAERSSWGPLPGSATEAQNISELLSSKSIPTTFMNASSANEESFKALSGNSPSLLHIATHGFFYADDQKDEMQNFLRSIKGFENLDFTQVIMTRSGILFSGANQAWRGELPDENIEDGILTAEEISHLNLSHTDMIVLSACETGLGDAISTEGIFGLQRAFKLAGVNTLVMSLWKVPDSETSQLMQLFYNNWLGGMEKHQAFAAAQRKLKEEKPNPYFWAGFVMLD